MFGPTFVAQTRLSQNRIRTVTTRGGKAFSQTNRVTRSQRCQTRGQRETNTENEMEICK